MAYEVEQKFQMASQEEFLSFCERMKELLPNRYRGIIHPIITEQDRYYNHPQRDFKQTDEAFRVRYREGKGFVTYKGPKLDAQTKTRREIELPIFTHGDSETVQCEAELEKWDELIKALGFTPVGTVFKIRRKINFWWEGFAVEMSLDQVPKAGFFVELELIAPTEKELDITRQTLLQIADALKLEAIVRKSYLDLVLNS